MRTKVTLILILLNVILLGVIIYARRQSQVDQEQARLSKRVLGEKAVGIKSLEITATGKDGSIRIERASGTSPWELKSPIDWPANDFAIRRIVQELEFLDAETSFPVADLEKNGQSLSDYGLSPARLTLSITRLSTPEPTRLEIGDITKVGNRLYVLSPDGQRVHVVNRSLAESLIVGMENLRTDTLFTIPVFEVRSLGLQNAAPAPRVRIRRDGTRWVFEAPIVTRASKASTEVVLSSLNRLRALSFLKDVPAAESGLDKPDLRISVEGNNRRETLLVGLPYKEQPAPPQQTLVPVTAYYARMEDRSQVFITTIPDGVFQDLRRAQESLRDTRILDFDTETVTSISISAPGLPEPVVLRRNDTAGWQIIRGAEGMDDLPADTQLVSTLLKRLSLLTVAPHTAKESGFLRDAPSDTEIENYGFNLPQREITLNLAGTTPGQTPPKITLQIGLSSTNGGTVQARVVGQPFIYAVAANTLNDLPATTNFYRERTLSTLPEGSHLIGLRLIDNEQPETPLLDLQTTEGKSWDDTLANEPEARRTALKALIDGVTTLRAKQFVGNKFTTTTLVDGRQQPWRYRLEATLSLVSSTGAKQASTSTLQIAQRAGGGIQLAGSQEFDAVFSLEQPMLDALWSLTYGSRDPGPPTLP